MGLAYVVALVIGLAAPVLQFVADAQMRAFIRMREPGQAMDRGLWALSRHPNYFGEVSFWVALALFYQEIIDRVSRAARVSSSIYGLEIREPPRYAKSCGSREAADGEHVEDGDE